MNYLVLGVHPEDVEKEAAKKEIDEAIEKLLAQKEELLQMKKIYNIKITVVWIKNAAVFFMSMDSEVALTLPTSP